MPLAALADEIVTSTAFRDDLANHLRHAREGHIVTVIHTNGEEAVAVVSRRLLAEQFQTLHELEEGLEAALDTIALLSNPRAVEALDAATAEVAEGGGLSVDDARRRLGWPRKQHSQRLKSASQRA